MIHIEELSFYREGKAIVNNVNWKVKKGEHWAVLGANGSGKTTLLKLLTGYEWASKGRISVLDNQFGRTNLQELRKKIGWVSASLDQRYQMYEHLPCVDVIVSGVHASIGVHESITKADEQRAIELAQSFGLESTMYQPLTTLSQGERKKVFLARAIINRPELLILDEATSGLDLYAREQLLEEIESLLMKADAPTLLYVTHYPEEIIPAINNVLLLKEGQVLASGQKEEVMTSENLSNTLGLPIDVSWSNERPWVKPVHFLDAKKNMLKY
ncbi:ABC transporter ATP-binding protein [Shouchella patagoniensis]|uniref:ABC transporter ATP-binding protein n=1 Tax=Shouchella patagoniensis TaxID=228576 RepID=UPI000994AC3C|nr:ABC transporter ATP-binding protein [Shouchella patagoniensis]